MDQIVARGPGTHPALREALRLRERLREGGPSEIFCPDPRAARDGVRPLAELTPAAGRVLVVHVAGTQPPLPGWMAGSSEALVLRIHDGAGGLGRLRRRTRLALPTSAAGAELLREAGFAKVRTVAPALGPADLAVRPGRPRLGLPSRAEGRLVAGLGPLAPGHGCELLLQAFHVLRTYLRRDARLFIAGLWADTGFVALLRRYAAELALPGVELRWGLAEEALAELGARADVAVCTSPGAGGLAALRALTQRVPLVALRPGPAAEAAGSAGLVLERAGPALLAEALARVLDDGKLAARLRDGGVARLRELRPAAAAGALAAAVRSAAP